MGIKLDKTGYHKRCQDQKCAQANQQYRQSTKLSPNDAAAYCNWGSLLITWSTLLEGIARDEKLQEAENLLNVAFHLDSCNAYNLACAKAMRGKSAEARRLLEEAKRRGTLPSLQHLREDGGLNSIRELDWFLLLLET